MKFLKCSQNKVEKKHFCVKQNGIRTFFLIFMKSKYFSKDVTKDAWNDIQNEVRDKKISDLEIVCNSF